MASCPITSWQTDGEKSESSDRFYFLWLQNQKESCDKYVQCIKKQHHFATEIHIAKAMFFPVVIYVCEN